MKCTFCCTEIDEKKLKRTRRYKNHPRRFCSQKCVRRDWHVRNNNHKVSTLLNGPNLESATGKGLYWEVHAQRLIGGRVLALETMNQPFDIELPNGKMVDVKSSNVHLRKRVYGKTVRDWKNKTGWWAFHRDGDNKPDYYFCIGLDKDRRLSPVNTYQRLLNIAQNLLYCMITSLSLTGVPLAYARYPKSIRSTYPKPNRHTAAKSRLGNEPA